MKSFIANEVQLTIFCYLILIIYSKMRLLIKNLPITEGFLDIYIDLIRFKAFLRIIAVMPQIVKSSKL